MARPLVHRMVHKQDRDDIVLELTEADQNWLTLNAITWSGVLAR